MLLFHNLALNRADNPVGLIEAAMDISQRGLSGDCAARAGPPAQEWRPYQRQPPANVHLESGG